MKSAAALFFAVSILVASTASAAATRRKGGTPSIDTFGVMKNLKQSPARQMSVEDLEETRGGSMFSIVMLAYLSKLAIRCVSNR